MCGIIRAIKTSRDTQWVALGHMWVRHGGWTVQSSCRARRGRGPSVWPEQNMRHGCHYPGQPTPGKTRMTWYSYRAIMLSVLLGMGGNLHTQTGKKHILALQFLNCADRRWLCLLLDDFVVDCDLAGSPVWLPPSVASLSASSVPCPLTVSALISDWSNYVTFCFLVSIIG